MRKITTLTIILALVFTMRASAFSDYTWTGINDGDWNDSGNWGGGPPGTFPSLPGDAATIPGTANSPHVNVDVTVGTVIIETPADLFIDLGQTLTIASTDGLTIEDLGVLNIEGGTLELTGGGTIDIMGLGGITFRNADGTIAFGGTNASYCIPLGPDPGESSPRVAIGTRVGQTFKGTLEPVFGSNPTVTMETNNRMRGVLDIQVTLVNNGWVEADRTGDITLNVHPKSGDGQWRVIDPGAKIVSNVPVSGGECSLIFITAGVLDVNQSWNSCGDLFMDQSGGKIDVAENMQLRVGTCSSGPGCQQ